MSSKSRPVTAGGRARWGHVLLPVVLLPVVPIAVGFLVLAEGGVFGL
ncbi:hypothetical protein [Streptomyces virginiae]